MPSQSSQPPAENPQAEQNLANPQIVLTQPDYDHLHRTEYRVTAESTQLALSQSDYERFRAFALEKIGLDYPEDKRSILSRGLAEAMKLTGVANLDQLYTLLTRSSSTSSVWDQLISTLTVGETYFFRNANQFDALTQRILPEILLQRGNLDRRIRIWCAGCATGEEPYSIAIALHELVPQIESWNILILATDINRDALSKAQEGVYSTWSFRGVDKRIQDTYFRMLDGKRFAIADEIKRMVTFDYLNLVADAYPSLTNNTNAMDLIFCRNVTIYFTAPVTQKVVHDFFHCLVDGGWLIPGPSEPNMIFYNDLKAKNFPGTVVYQKPITPAPNTAPLFVRPAPPPPPVPPPAPVFKEPPKPALPPRDAPKPVPPPDPYQAAVSLMHAGQPDEALVMLYKKLDLDPGFARTYCLLGKIYANKGDLDKAQHWCEKAIQKDRLHPEPYYILSMIYQQQGLLDMAVEMLKKTVYLDRQFVLAHYNLAQIYQHQKEAVLAHKSLQNALQLLQAQAKDALVPEGDGLLVRRLLELVSSQIEQGE